MATENVALAAGAEGGTLSEPDTQQQSPQGAIVNDFSIQIATVNGSGSQSANSVLLKSIFRMGIPVSGKNLFPSNIAGLPTWYTIRASKAGYVARKKEIDILIGDESRNFQEDMLSSSARRQFMRSQPTCGSSATMSPATQFRSTN
jgi:2-oxoglutarate ferredoxin oxidoreductase subunit alpha